MDDPRWLRIIIVGLVLAALAIGYYLISGAFSLKSNKPQTQTNIIVEATPAPKVANNPNTIPSAPPSYSPSSTPQSAYQKIVERNQAQVQTLPKTGLPLGFLGILSISIMITGLGLRKFPN